MFEKLDSSSSFSNTNNAVYAELLKNYQDLVKNLIAQFADRFNFNELVQSAFNNGTNLDIFKSDWRTGNFVLP